MPYKDKQREKEYKREYMRKYYYRPHVMARVKKYLERPDVKQRRKELAKEHRKTYYSKSREQILERNRKYQQIPKVRVRLKGYMKEYHKEYDQTASGKLTRLKAKSNRRERTQNVITLWSKEEWRKVLRNSNGFCNGFKRKPHFVGIEQLTLDHIHPLSKAKKDRIYTINDIQPLCPDCNSTKGIYI